MKKGYSSVPSYFTDPDDSSSKELQDGYSDASPLVNNRTTWWTPRLSRKTFMLRSRTRGIKLLGVITFISLLMYFYFSSNTAHIDQLSSSEITITDLFKSVPSADHIKTHFTRYASHSHLAGSEQDQNLAIWTRNQWIEYGITDTKIETFYPVLNYPKTRRLAIVNGSQELLYEAVLEEHENEQVPTFHAYSGDGNVTGPVVYVNYGRISDFQSLQIRGVLFKGTIALIRNGIISRGMKVKMAEKFGCIGALLYSDPDDHDGPGTFVERGSVQYVSQGVGDPSTPGYASSDVNVTRINLDKSNALPGIPSLPISVKDALPLLKATEGFGVPADITWLGGLCNVTYSSGPSEALVNLVNINEYQAKPIWNVIGTIKGSDEPDQKIIIGNHRDAWGYGAVDPSSGSAVLTELARTLGVLVANGWRPKRTIILASWDAEEYGAVGSTEWVEKHTSWLKQEAIAYLNVDYAVSGKHFNVQASPLLNRLLYQITQDVIDPESSRTVFDRWKFERGLEDVSIFEEELPVPLCDPLDVESDHVGFFHHLGIASLSMGFRGSNSVQHSDFDTIDWMEQFGDPTFAYHRTLTQIWGLLVMHLSSDTILPLYPEDYVPELSRYIKQLGSHQGCMTFPYISSSLDSLERAARHLDKKRQKRECQLKDKKHRHKKLKRHVREINERVSRFESALVDAQGAIAERPWFTHMVYGPDQYSGKPVAFPSLLEAIESGDPIFLQWTEQRIGNILSQAQKTLKGHFEEDDDLVESDSTC